ncbi:MAG: metal ABC transporter solute-binding protein, Zn/Mn family [Planctomycetaceae bacterium]
MSQAFAEWRGLWRSTRRLSPAAALLACLLLAGCSVDSGASTGAGTSKKLHVLATTGIIGDVAQIIGGDEAHIEALMGPGVDPHLYQPTARDQGRLRAAQLVLYNGLHLEGKMIEVFENLAQSLPVVAVTRDIPDGHLLSWQAAAGMHDPHVWFDVRLWKQVATTIAEALATADPDHAEKYNARRDAYLAELEQLDEYCRRRSAEVPSGQRVLITSHDAFHYFGRAYGFEVVGIQGISTETEAGLRAITDAVDLIRRRNIRAIFPETSVPRAAIERVARDSGARLGAELYSDALGPADGPAGNYIGMIRENIDHIVGALTGNVE